MINNKIAHMGAGEQSPKLEMASKEISDVLKKYDIAGVVQLFTPGHTKYTLNIAPSFSVASINDVGRLVITDPLVDPENEEPAKIKIRDTVNMLANLRMYLGKLTMVLTQSEIAVRQRFKIDPPPSRPGPPPIKN